MKRYCVCNVTFYFSFDKLVMIRETIKLWGEKGEYLEKEIKGQLFSQSHMLQILCLNQESLKRPLIDV